MIFQKNIIQLNLMNIVKVRQEILENLAFSEKETDIYKVFQTGDLENLSGLEEDERKKLSSLIKLRDALYSNEFRCFISKVTGCGYLSGKMIDISVNIYGQGGHLLNHDDVIGTREVSFILYLVDPDEAWLPSYGGALRLYPTVRPSFPDCDYEKAIFPVWNQLCFFQVQPGRSFHDVEEVYQENKWRLSISGWFHRPQPGEEGWQEPKISSENVLSTLQILHSDIQNYDEPRMEPKICSITFNDEFNEFLKDHLSYLKDWINPEYLNYEKMMQLRETFLDYSVLELPNFLESTLSNHIKNWILDIEKSSSIQTLLDISPPWKLAKPLHKHRYLYIDSPDSSFDSPLISLLQNLFNHPSFHQWIHFCTTLIPSTFSALIRRFRPGLDYTLAIPHTSLSPILDLILSLTPSGHWDHGKNGGYHLYMTPPTPIHSILFNSNPSWNTFHFILRDSGVLHFIKYLSLYSQASRWDILSHFYFSDS
ncbi:hypothetical protein PNEG_03020 [Pneumocystis murina B123]|uniref:Fe2OG dioxygenase domain-containing protein n=1 Tax=Pneumocystis murina (strain B123) TaxID=1069680 RepID=M7PDJ9_PNEMU|nr:hypothetical protein PNEG_03020 [Pneumocystis murina B123]EMR08539.1 hypothetical protein PNEG_03020 [Pneumocystis murina B123]